MCTTNCKSVLQYVAVCCAWEWDITSLCCSLMQCVAVRFSSVYGDQNSQVSVAVAMTLPWGVWSSLQDEQRDHHVRILHSKIPRPVCAAGCCSVLQCVAVCCSRVRAVYILPRPVCAAVCCSVMRCVAVCCSRVRAVYIPVCAHSRTRALHIFHKILWDTCFLRSYRMTLMMLIIRKIWGMNIWIWYSYVWHDSFILWHDSSYDAHHS